MRETFYYCYLFGRDALSRKKKQWPHAFTIFTFALSLNPRRVGRPDGDLDDRTTVHFRVFFHLGTGRDERISLNRAYRGGIVVGLLVVRAHREAGIHAVSYGGSPDEIALLHPELALDMGGERGGLILVQRLELLPYAGGYGERSPPCSAGRSARTR